MNGGDDDDSLGRLDVHVVDDSDGSILIRLFLLLLFVIESYCWAVDANLPMIFFLLFSVVINWLGVLFIAVAADDGRLLSFVEVDFFVKIISMRIFVLFFNKNGNICTNLVLYHLLVFYT